MNKKWMMTLSIAAVALGLGLLAACGAEPTATPAPTATTAPVVAAATPTAPAPAATATVPAPTAPPAVPTATRPPAVTPPGTPVATGQELFNSKFCSRCHGANGEGGFGPPLANTIATADQAVSKVRGTPRRNMPSFRENQVTNEEIGKIIAYVKTLPTPAARGTYQFTPAAGAPAGMVTFINEGCAACHGIPPSVAGTKLDAAGEITQVRTPRARMGAYTVEQITDADVTTVNEWLRSLPTPTPRPPAATPTP